MGLGHPQKKASPDTTYTGKPAAKPPQSTPNLQPKTTKKWVRATGKQNTRKRPPQKTTKGTQTNNHKATIYNKPEPERWQRAKRNKQYLRTRYYQEGKQRETVIKMKKGLNTLSIASPNPDHFVANQVQQDKTQQLTKRKTHIEIIQETHITRDLRYAKKWIQNNHISSNKKTPKLPRNTISHENTYPE